MFETLSKWKMGDARREMDRRERATGMLIRVLIYAAILFIIMAVRYAR